MQAFDAIRSALVRKCADTRLGHAVHSILLLSKVFLPLQCGFWNCMVVGKELRTSRDQAIFVLGPSFPFQTRPSPSQSCHPNPNVPSSIADTDDSCL